MALQTQVGLLSVFDIRKVEQAKGRALILVAHAIEADHGTRLSRMDEAAALSGYLRQRLCNDGFWPESKDLTITLGERQSPVADDAHFAVTLPGYASTWSARRFEDAVCLAAKRFVRLVAPGAPIGRYLLDFERGGRLFSWSYRAGLETGAAAELECDLSRDRFRASLNVTTETEPSRRFQVYQCGADSSEWFDLFRKVRVSKTAATVEADPRMFVRVVRNGRSAAKWTGNGASLERFVVELGPKRPHVVRKFQLKLRGPPDS